MYTQVDNTAISVDVLQKKVESVEKKSDCYILSGVDRSYNSPQLHIYLVGGWFTTHLKNMRTVKLDHETPGIGVKIKNSLKFHPLVIYFRPFRVDPPSSPLPSDRSHKSTSGFAASRRRCSLSRRRYLELQTDRGDG